MRTLEDLDMLVGEGVVRNATEAIVVAVEHVATEYKIKKSVKCDISLIDLLKFAIKNEEARASQLDGALAGSDAHRSLERARNILGEDPHDPNNLLMAMKFVIDAYEKNNEDEHWQYGGAKSGESVKSKE